MEQIRRRDNRILMLYGLSFVGKINAYEVTPFMFLLQYLGREMKQKTVNYDFTFAWRRPLSKEVQDDMVCLAQMGFLDSKGMIEVNETGRRYLKKHNEFIRNVSFESFLALITQQFPLKEYEYLCAEIHELQGKDIVPYTEKIDHFANRELGKKSAVTIKVIEKMIDDKRKMLKRNIT
ncbi:hypothetical protein [Bacillus bombysepticus]|uniref:hypothetical protein n=1 Tax=Bacillus bombysepticus TaxID=658666 RepID=UPI003018F761